MENVLIVDLGVEGGGATIRGRQTETGWIFWQSGSSMDFDENDRETWRDWAAEPVTDLEEALPRDWVMMYPISVHPSFTDWLWEHYSRERQKLPPDLLQSQERRVHQHWVVRLRRGDSV